MPQNVDPEDGLIYDVYERVRTLDNLHRLQRCWQANWGGVWMK